MSTLGSSPAYKLGAHVLFEIDDEFSYVQTIFIGLPFHSACVGVPNFEVEHVERARGLGYDVWPCERCATQGHDGSGVCGVCNGERVRPLSDADAAWAMTRDHDLCHALGALAEGWPFPPVLYLASLGFEKFPPGLFQHEERLAFAFQRTLVELRKLRAWAGEGSSTAALLALLGYPQD